MRWGAILLSVIGVAALGTAASAARAGGVLTYHADNQRRGNFVVPSLTWARARHVHEDSGFRARITGHVYAQPLYWPTEGGALVLVATEDDIVYALDARSGKTVWTRKLGRPVPLETLPCGDIDPLGITGTPVIDPRRRAIYLDAMVRDPHTGVPTHELFALALATGAILPGWPVDVHTALVRQGLTFRARNQNQRGALAILNGTLYVPYGGHDGDCARYHGWVVGVQLDHPQALESWHTAAQAGGIWAPAGVSTDEHSVYVATGNTMNTTRWAGGEAVIRLPPSLKFSGAAADFFVPRDWRAMDQEDADLGGVAPMLFTVRAERFVLALGKDGKAYLLNRHNLGGIGGQLLAVPVSDSQIRTASAEFPVEDGAMIAFQGPGSECPAAERGDLTVLHLSAGPPPALSTAWCAPVRGRGAPIVTTTDGRRDPIVWMLGAEGDERLYGFRGDSGQRLFVSPPLPGLRRFQTLIATAHRLYVAADDAVYAFAF